METYDYKFWWNVVLSLATSVLAVLAWVRKPGEEAGIAVNKLRDLLKTDVAKLRELMSTEVADIRLLNARLEERVKHLPAGDDVAELSGDVKAIKAQLASLTGTQTAQSLALNRIETWLHDMNRRNH